VSQWIPLDMPRVPVELRTLGWVGWRAEWDAAREKWRKPPYQIGAPHQLASNANPAHWRNEGDVMEVRALAPELFDGYGVALTSGIVFIDLDDVRDPASGVVAPWAWRLVEVFDSWTEVSASGTGVHIFALGQLPGTGLVDCLDGDRGRFAYLTGHSLTVPARPLADRQRLVTLLAQHVRPADTPAGGTSGTDRAETPIPAGQRNDRLFRIARSFVRQGLHGAALEQALLAVSHGRCVPVPPDADVVKIARHAERLPDRRSV
jgi:hypothetical protein